MLKKVAIMSQEAFAPLLVCVAKKFGTSFHLSWRNHLGIEGNDWPGAKSPHLYYDDHHLVGKGAQQYSQWLVTQVKARAKSLR